MKKPYHIPSGFDSFLLIKFFGEKAWQKEFIQGKFFMNTVEFFQQHEAGKTKQYDIYEGTQTYLRTTEETHWVFQPDNNGTYWIVQKSGAPSSKQVIYEAALGRKVEAEKKLLCMYTLWGNSTDKQFYKIDPSILDDFGKYAAIVTNTPLFLRRIKEKASLLKNQMGSDPEYGFVNYFDRKSLPANFPLGIYRKIQEDSIHQNEFRISLDMKHIKGAYKDFQIENSDICVPLETEQLINMSAINIAGLQFGML